MASFWWCEEEWGLRTQIQNDFTVYKLVGSYNTELWKLRVLKSGKRFGSLKSGRTKAVTIYSGDAKTFPFVLLILKPLGHAWWVEEKERKYGMEDEVPESTVFRTPKWSFSSWYTDSLLKTADTAFYTEPIEYYQHFIFTNLPLFVCNNSITSTLSQTATQKETYISRTQIFRQMKREREKWTLLLLVHLAGQPLKKKVIFPKHLNF